MYKKEIELAYILIIWLKAVSNESRLKFNSQKQIEPYQISSSTA